jgi:hypothetical protein
VTGFPVLHSKLDVLTLQPLVVGQTGHLLPRLSVSREYIPVHIGMSRVVPLPRWIRVVVWVFVSNERACTIRFLNRIVHAAETVALFPCNGRIHCVRPSLFLSTSALPVVENVILARRSLTGIKCLSQNRIYPTDKSLQCLC